MPDPVAYLDLDALRAALRKRALLLVGLAVLAGILGAVAYSMLVRHRAEGVYTLGALELKEKKSPQSRPRTDTSLPLAADSGLLEFRRGISLQDYKTLAPRFDAKAFEAFSARLGAEDRAIAERVRQELAIEDRRRELLAPVYGSTRLDLRELGESAKPQENAVLALRISYASRDRERARRAVEITGDFVGETIFHAAIRELVEVRAREYEAQRLVSENVLINARFTISQLDGKGRALEKLRASFPELARATPQQVVSVAEGGARYLSPSIQVVGVESTLAEYRERIATAERNMRKAQAQETYYRRVAARIAESPPSTMLLRELSSTVTATFASANDSDGAIAEGRNEALLDLVAVAALRERGLQFVIAPAIVERDPSLVWKTGAIVALIVIAAGVAVILASVWWRPGRRDPRA